MFGWVRRVLPQRTDDRGQDTARLEERAREVQAQTVRIRRIRREAQVAEMRLKGRP